MTARPHFPESQNRLSGYQFPGPALPFFSILDQSLRAFQHHTAVALRTQHGSQLLKPVLSLNRLHSGGRPARIYLLDQLEMAVAKAGDLRQMGYAQHLVKLVSVASFRPTESALLPPTPMSISSKTSVGMGSATLTRSLWPGRSCSFPRRMQWRP